MEDVLAVQLVEVPVIFELKGLAATDLGCLIDLEQTLIERGKIVTGIEDDIIL